MQIIHKVNLKFNEFLDEGNYSIPRLTSGYKGDKVPVFKVPQEKAASSAPHAPMVTPSNNSNTVNKNGSPRPAGIASVWAATEGFDVPESQRRAPTPPVHVPDQSAHEVGADGHKAPSRRGSDNAMNDTDSVVSDITTNSTAHTNTLHGKAPTARRSSLNMLFGMGSGGGSRNGSFTENNGATAGVPAGVTAGAGAHRKISRKSVLISPGAAGYNGGAIQVSIWYNS